MAVIKANVPFLSKTSQLVRLRRGIEARRNFSTSPAEILTTMTAMMETAKIASGLPWWLFIPAVTVTIRTSFTLPLAVLQRRRLIKQAELRPIVSAMGPLLRLKLAQRAVQSKARESTKPVSEGGFIQGAASSLSYDQIVVLAAKERRKRQKELFKTHKCELWKNMLLPIAQIPVWIALSATVRELTGYTEVSGAPLDPTLTMEGFSFITDLSVADPIGVLPIVLGGLMITNVEWNYMAYKVSRPLVQRSQRITPQESLLNLGRFGAVFLMAISTQAPAALVLYWSSSNLFSLLQNVFLDTFLPVRKNYQTNFLKKTINPNSMPLFERKVIRI